MIKVSEYNKCPACIFGPMLMPFGKNVGKPLIDCDEDYLKWLADQGWTYVILQEFWHANDHEPDQHPDIVLAKLQK